MQYITFREGFIDDAANTVSNAASAVKNRVQTNVGNMANAVNGAINSVKEFGRGISSKASNAADTVTKAASTVGAKGLVKPNDAPLLSQQAKDAKNSLVNGASKVANTVSRPVKGVLNRARSFI